VLHYGELAVRVQALGPATPQRVLETICAVRAAKLPNPAVLGNSGSFFKNPVVPLEQAQALLARFPALVHYPTGSGTVKLAAGWLIDQCGLKGLRIGPVGVYSKQALVLVNHGGATGADLMVLVQHVQATVQAKFGVWLEVEPVVIVCPHLMVRLKLQAYNFNSVD
jgi:UDP-N-acetylmuramate dehydrogenase